MIRTFLLLIVAFVAIVTSDQNITLTLDFNGGWCAICEPVINNYACSDGAGNWNSGKKLLLNSAPAGNLLTSVIVTMYGVWGCGDNNVSTITAMLQGNEIQTIQTNGTCECRTCDSVLIFNWQSPTGFPNYNYNTNGINRFQILVPQGVICVHEAILTLTYTSTSQLIQPYTPPTCDSFGGCGPNGTCVTNSSMTETNCQCDTDYFGPNCQCFVPSDGLATDRPAILDPAKSGFFQQDLLTLTLNISAKYHNTTIAFRYSSNQTCDFSNPNNDIIWTTIFDPDNCVYVYQVTIPWGLSSPQCIVNRSVTPEWIIFTGQMDLVLYEALPPLKLPNQNIPITRLLESPLIFQVIYPSSVTMNIGDPTIYSPVIVQAAIDQQIFTTSISSPPGTGFVRLMTVTQYPFHLISPFEILYDTTKYQVTITSDSANGNTTCLNDGTNCIQYWDITISPFTNVCDIDGLYYFNFSVGCLLSVVNSCPLTSNNSHGSIMFAVTSEDFCPQIVESIDLTGTFNSYQDPTHVVPKISFMQGQTAYFLVVVASQKATITNTTVGDLVLIYGNGTQVLLYHNGNTTPAGASVNCIVHNDVITNTESSIQLELLPTLFTPTNKIMETYTFEVTVDVTFFNTQKKRAIIAIVQPPEIYADKAEVSVKQYSDGVALRAMVGILIGVMLLIL
jgi:hypothetical protein